MASGKLRRFNIKINEARWGSVAFAVASLLDIEGALRRFWDIDRYLCGQDQDPVGAGAGGRGDKDDDSKLLERSDNAITSPFFWGCMMTLDAMCSVSRKSFWWAESCTCHSHLDWDQASPDLRSQIMKCPLRGLRLPELSSGAFFRTFASLCDVTIADLLLQLPTELDVAQRGLLLQDVERARGYILFALTLKLSSFAQPPALLFAIADRDRTVATNAIQKCLGSTCNHTRVQALQSEPLLSQARAFIHGEDMRNLQELFRFAAELRFGWSSERCVEGGHALIHVRGSMARRHTEAYDSLSLRLPQIKEALQNDQTFLPSLLSCLESARTPARLFARLGFSQHPSASLAKDGWDPIYRKHLQERSAYSVPQSCARPFSSAAK